MHIKQKYIHALENAIDFIISNTDGADEENQEKETLKILRDLSNKMKESMYKKEAYNYVNKLLKKK